MQRKKIFCFDGNIASGKTKLVDLLSDHLSCDSYMENFEASNTFLQEYYKNTSKAACQSNWMGLQAEVLSRWIYIIEDIFRSDCDIVIIDRPVTSAICFLWTARDMGLISQQVFQCLYELSLAYLSTANTRISADWYFITIDTPSDLCLKRALKRIEETKLEVSPKNFVGTDKLDPNVFTKQHFDKLDGYVKLLSNHLYNYHKTSSNFHFKMFMGDDSDNLFNDVLQYIKECS